VFPHIQPLHGSLKDGQRISVRNQEDGDAIMPRLELLKIRNTQGEWNNNKPS